MPQPRPSHRGHPQSDHQEQNAIGAGQVRQARQCARPRPPPQPVPLHAPIGADQGQGSRHREGREIVRGHPVDRVEPAESAEQGCPHRISRPTEETVAQREGQDRHQGGQEDGGNLGGAIRCSGQGEAHPGQDGGKGHPVQVAGMGDRRRHSQVVPDQILHEAPAGVQVLGHVVVIVGIHIARLVQRKGGQDAKRQRRQEHQEQRLARRPAGFRRISPCYHRAPPFTR